MIDTGLSETDRVVRKITENLHRLDVAPAAEAAQFMRLASLGMSVRDLAKQLGRTQRYVRDRLKIAELPTKARRLVDARTWSIADALAATRLLDHPELLDELTEQGRGNVEHRISRMLADIEREAAVRALVEQAQTDGLNLVEANDTQRALTTLGIEPSNHEAEACHGWIVRAPTFGAPTLVAVCTNPKSHTKRGTSTVKATAPASQGLSNEEATRRKLERDANTERIAAITAAVAGKVTKTEASTLVLRALLDSVSADDAKKAAKILEIDGDKDTYWPTALWAHTADSDAALQRAGLTVALVAGNRHIHSGYSDPRQLDTQVAEFLKHRGWKPSAHDRARLKALKTNTR